MVTTEWGTWVRVIHNLWCYNLVIIFGIVKYFGDDFVDVGKRCR